MRMPAVVSYKLGVNLLNLSTRKWVNISQNSNYSFKQTWLVPSSFLLCHGWGHFCVLFFGVIILISFFYLFRSQRQGCIHILPYMAIKHHLGDDPPRRSEVTLLAIISEANIQTHRLWAIPSTSNHQRFMYPDCSRGPLTNQRGRDKWKKEKNSD